MGIWRTLKCQGRPTGRHETAFVEVAGRFYLIGGRESRAIDRFDPETLTWSRMTVTTPLIHHFQPVVFDKKVYMLGAMTSDYPSEVTFPNIQIYDPANDAWSLGDVIPEARRRGSAGTLLHDGKIYMAGGIIHGHTSGTVAWFDEYDPLSGAWRTLPDAPRGRDHFFAVAANDRFYCIGGRNTSVHEPSFDAFFGAVIHEVDCFDFKTGAWSTLDRRSNLPLGSAAGGTVLLDGRIVYFGGETAEKALDAARAFDPRTGIWTDLPSLRQGRHGTQAVVYRDRIYVASGSPVRGGGRVESIEMYS